MEAPCPFSLSEQGGSHCSSNLSFNTPRLLTPSSHTGQQIPSSHPRRNPRRPLGAEIFQNFPQPTPSVGVLMNGDTSHSASNFQTQKAQL